jgi:ankyrin repeat protein
MLETFTNEKDSQGTNALLNACLNGNTKCIRLLLENGANPKVHWKTNKNVNCLTLCYKNIEALRIFSEMNLFEKEEWKKGYDMNKGYDRDPDVKTCLEFMQIHF